MLNPPSGQPKVKILLVDDDEFILDLYKLALEKEGFHILSAQDGAAGLAAAASEKPDLILLDLVMPNMDGFETLAKLKADAATNKIPVVILSGMKQDEDVSRALRLGAAAFLKKDQTLPTEAPNKIRKVLGLPPVEPNSW